MIIDSITVIEPQIRAGTVRALSVTSATKWWSLPDITPIDARVPGYDVQTWVGIAAPKGAPSLIVQRLNQAMKEAAKDPTVQERLQKIVRASSSNEMRADSSKT